MRKTLLGVTVLIATAGAIALTTTAYAKKPGGGGVGGGCPRNIECLDVWDPVICDNGIVYSNDCYAYRACATGCVPFGDVAAIIKPGKCPRDIQCPDVYDPVTCSNGVEYPNACYAYRACATGCGAS